MEIITSRQNPLCVQIRKLSSSAAARSEAGLFLCDSPKLLGEAAKWAPERIRTVVFTSGAALPELGEQVRLVQVPADVMASLSPARTPQGTLGLCALEERPLPERLTGRRYVVLDGVQDPGNVGTILRTADAFGADGMLLVNGCADLYNPKTVRATMGAVFRCPVWRCGCEEAASLLRRSGISLYGAALRSDTVDARSVSYDPAAIAIGSEGRGLSVALLALCDKTIRIPMNQRCESLNAAAAATVLLWECARND